MVRRTGLSQTMAWDGVDIGWRDLVHPFFHAINTGIVNICPEIDCGCLRHDVIKCFFCVRFASPKKSQSPNDVLSLAMRLNEKIGIAANAKQTRLSYLKSEILESDAS